MLFVASTWFTESLSSSKVRSVSLRVTDLQAYPSSLQYPEYRDYQTLVGEFAPQSTIWKGLWARMTGLRPRLAEVVWGQGTDESSARKEIK